MVPSRGQCTAPCAVFFDASDTTASATTRPFHELDYTWDYADPASSTLPRVVGKFDHNRSKGPVAAHVFDPGYLKIGPNGQDISAYVNQYGLYVGPPLKYPVKVTVKDLNNNSESLTQEITVNPFAGKIYFVDAVSGSDANTGLSAAQPWMTFAKAFSSTNGVLAGDAVLFRRGQTFPFYAGVMAKSGVVYGAYGIGESPLMQNAGLNDQWSMALNLGGTSNTVISDLRFDLAKQLYPNPGGAVFDNGSHGLFLRSRLENMGGSAIVTNSGDPRATDGVFLVDSAVKDVGGAVYYERSKLVLLNNVLTGVQSHILYTSINKGVISGTHFSNWDLISMSKTALRITGGAWEAYGVPSNDIVISDNLFQGGIRPDGYHNFTALEFSPNIDPPLHRMENVLFERNRVLNAANSIKVGPGYHHLTIRNNFLEVPWLEGWAAINFGGSQCGGCTTPGSSDIEIAGNTIVGDNDSPLIYIPNNGNVVNHSDIRVRNNIVMSTSRGGEGVRVTPELLPELISSNNLYYFPNNLNPFNFNGDWHSFASWQSYSGKDGNSRLADPRFLNLNGSDNAFRTPDDSPVLQSVSPAINNGMTLPLFEDINGTPRIDSQGAFMGGAPDIGAFEYR